MYVSGTEQNHGKPQDRVASQIVFHGFPFYDLIYYYSMAFQTGMHSVRKSAWLAFLVSTFLTDITGLCREDIDFIAFRLQILPYLCGKLLMCMSSGQHFFHIHNIRDFCNTGKKYSLRIGSDLFFTFFQCSHCRRPGPGGIISLAFLPTDRPDTLFDSYPFCIQQTILINWILGYKFFKFLYIHIVFSSVRSSSTYGMAHDS